MVSVKKYVSTKYLSAKNIGEHAGKIVVIDAAFETIIADEGKLALRLSGIESPFVLNQTNLAILTAAYGEDTDEWINHKIKLNIVKVNYSGQMVDGIQVSPT